MVEAGTRQFAESSRKRSAAERVYLEYYSFREAPFSITPDPDFLFLSNTHGSVINKILYGINSRMGFILLIGEVGTGKTTICRSILDNLDGKAETVYIINPSLSGRELISSILDDLGIQTSPEASKKELIACLNQFLLSTEEKGPVVIIIDDAQTMPMDALEDLRLLSNLETDKDKLLQMVLVGQPELLELINQQEMRQLRHRVSIRCQLEYLTRDEVERYISRRLFVAGNQGHVRFTPRAIKKLFRASQGIPRLINKICDVALVAGYIEDEFTIGSRHVDKAIRELGDIDFTVKPAPLERTVAHRNDRSDRIGRWLSFLVPSLLVLVVFMLPSDFEMLSHLKKRSHAPNESRPAQIASMAGNRVTPQAAPDPNPVTASPVKPPSLARYTLQLGSFKSRKRTNRAITAYRDMGIEAHWQRIELAETGAWYRLFAGHFATKGEAIRFRTDQELDESLVLHAPWAVTAGQADTAHELTPVRDLLQEHQYDSYVLQSPAGGFRLLSGVFIARGRAEKLALALDDLGLPAEVVPR